MVQGTWGNGRNAVLEKEGSYKGVLSEVLVNWEDENLQTVIGEQMGKMQNESYLSSHSC